MDLVFFYGQTFPDLFEFWNLELNRPRACSGKSLETKFVETKNVRLPVKLLKMRSNNRRIQSGEDVSDGLDQDIWEIPVQWTNLKKAILILLIFAISIITAKVQAELPRNEKGQVFYNEVIQLGNIAKDELYSRALAWFEKTFRWEKWQHKEKGEIGATKVFDATIKKEVTYFVGLVGYQILFLAEEGQYKYEVTDLKHDGWNSGYGSGGDLSNEKPACGKIGGIDKKLWVQIKKQADENICALINSLKAAMQKPAGYR